MNKNRVCLSLLIVLVSGAVAVTSAAAGQAGARPGALVVVGGGGTPDEVAARAIALAGGPDATIAVLPQASATEAAGVSTVRMFEELGARNVTNWRFEGSPGIEDMAGDWPTVEETARALEAADLIWFPGGAQGRLQRALDDADLADVIRRRHAAGAVVGGTSAGAAVLAEVMITGNEYDLETVTAGSTHVAEGLGLWREALVDQHFLARQRNNRLLAAVLDRPELIGVGIDERTAVIVQDGAFEVMGESAVIVLDAREARVVDVATGSRAAATDVRLHVLTAGMTFRVAR